MKAVEFVDAVRKVAVDGATASAISVIRRPPGRSPSLDLVGVSDWYKGLSGEDKVMLERALGICSQHSVAAVLEVLDGAVKVDVGASSDNYFELRYVRAGSSDVLCGPRGAVLHELL
jgi:hypothetical protein